MDHFFLSSEHGEIGEVSEASVSGSTTDGVIEELLRY